MEWNRQIVRERSAFVEFSWNAILNRQFEQRNKRYEKCILILEQHVEVFRGSKQNWPCSTALRIEIRTDKKGNQGLWEWEDRMCITITKTKSSHKSESKLMQSMQCVM